MSARPVLFLDVDGVLNRRDTRPGDDGVRDCVLRPLHSDWSARFTGVVETAKVAALRDVVERCMARIVVSSSWRMAFPTPADFALAIGIVDPLLDEPDLFHRDWSTPFKFSSTRAQEIAMWLADHPKVRRFAILDDHDIFGTGSWPRLEKHFVRTNAGVGVTPEDLTKVAALLGEPNMN